MTPENPKESAGRKKCPMDLLPSALLRETAWALQSGARKYGRFNWRTTPIHASTYHAAMMRHITAWVDGEHADPESGRSHIAHVAACCAILLDATEYGTLNGGAEEMIPVHVKSAATGSERNTHE